MQHYAITRTKRIVLQNFELILAIVAYSGIHGFMRIACSTSGVNISCLYFRNTNILLIHLCILLLLDMLLWEGWTRKPVNHTSWVTVVTPTDLPKLVRNRCLYNRKCWWRL